MQKFLGSFVGATQDGRSYTIDRYQDITLGETIYGLKSMQTREGNAVHRVSKGLYTITLFSKAVPLTSADPKAP